MLSTPKEKEHVNTDNQSTDFSQDKTLTQNGEIFFETLERIAQDNEQKVLRQDSKFDISEAQYQLVDKFCEDFLKQDAPLVWLTQGRTRLGTLKIIYNYPTPFFEKYHQIKLKLKGQWREAVKLLKLDKEKGKLRIATTPEDQIIGDILSHVPEGCEDHRVPNGWAMQDETKSRYALVKETTTDEGLVKRIEVSHNPAILSAWHKDLGSGNKWLRVSWKALNKWHHVLVERERLADPSQIIKALAVKGFPVTGRNRGHWVDYFAAYEEKNIILIPVVSMSTSMGWVNDRTFLCGDQVITTRENEQVIEYHASSIGENQVATGLRPKGSAEKCLEVYRHCENYPAIMFAIYASLAAPLLKLLDVPSFIFDFSGRSTKGKTTTLRIAASLWGNPNKIISTFQTTKVGLENNLATFNNLPVFLDDTKTATHKTTIPDFIYAMQTGLGKTRGSLTGTRKTSSWQTIALTTGEQKITEFSNDTGTTMRAFTWWGVPFTPVTGGNGESGAIADNIAWINGVINDNYGHLGPLFISKLIQNLPKIDIKSMYNAIYSRISDKLSAETSPAIASRMAYPIAIINLGGKLAEEYLGIKWVKLDSNYLGNILEGMKDFNRDEQALDLVYSWIVANKDYLGGTSKSEFCNREKWLEFKGAEDDDYYGVRTDIVDKLLKDNGYETKAMLRHWRDSGLLQCYQKNSCQGGMRLQGETILLTKFIKKKLVGKYEDKAC